MLRDSFHRTLFTVFALLPFWAFANPAAEDPAELFSKGVHCSTQLGSTQLGSTQLAQKSCPDNYHTCIGYITCCPWGYLYLDPCSEDREQDKTGACYQSLEDARADSNCSTIVRCY